MFRFTVTAPTAAPRPSRRSTNTKRAVSAKAIIVGPETVPPGRKCLESNNHRSTASSSDTWSTAISDPFSNEKAWAMKSWRVFASGAVTAPDDTSGWRANFDKLR